MILTVKERVKLKKEAHSLKPVVIIGQNGLTAPVLEEINRALDDHELIKIKVAGADKEVRQQTAEDICEQLNASFVNSIGHILILYRKRKED